MTIYYSYTELFSIEYYRNGKLEVTESSGAALENVAENARNVAVTNGFDRVIIRKRNSGKTVAIIE